MALVYESGVYTFKHIEHNYTIDLNDVPLEDAISHCAMGHTMGKLMWCIGREIFWIDLGIKKFGEITFDAHIMHAANCCAYAIGTDKIAQICNIKPCIIEYDNPTGSSECIVIDDHSLCSKKGKIYVVCKDQCFELGKPEPITTPTTLSHRCIHYNLICNKSKCKRYLKIVWTGTHLEVEHKGVSPCSIGDVTVYNAPYRCNAPQTSFIDRYYRVYSIPILTDAIQGIEIGDSGALLHFPGGTYVACHSSNEMMEANDCTLGPPISVKSSRNC